MNPPPPRPRPARHQSWLLAVLVALLSTAPAWAQTITGRIDGRVTDSSGAVLPGATISIVNTGTGLTITQVTDDNGTYTATNLPVGNYTVSAELEGFRRAQRTGVQLSADGRLSADFTLGVGQLTESVQVQAVTGEAVNRTSGEVARTIDQTQIRDLAFNGRNYLELASLIPGRRRHRLRSARPGHLAERDRPVDQRQPHQHQQPHHRRHVQRGLRLERVAGQQRQPQLHRGSEDADVELLGRARPQQRRRHQRRDAQRDQQPEGHRALRLPRREVRRAELLRRQGRQRQQDQAAARVPQLRGRDRRADQPQQAVLLPRTAVPHHQSLHQPDAADDSDVSRAERQLRAPPARRRRAGRHRRRHDPARPDDGPAVPRQRDPAEPDHDRRAGDRRHLPVHGR